MRKFIGITGLVLAAALAGAQNVSTVSEGIFRQEGIASWYGAEFAGRPTSSGEIFDPALYTAAHPILPFGTMIKVTNTHNNKSVIVKVNDRGPFVAARIVDISRAAAETLDMIRTGTAPVKVESLGVVALPKKNSLEPAGAVPAVLPEPQSAWLEMKEGESRQVQSASVLPFREASADSVLKMPVLPDGVANQNGNPAMYSSLALKAQAGKKYSFQVGAYKQPRNAVEAFDKLKKAGLNPAYEKYGDYYRVVLSNINGEDVLSVKERLSGAGFGEALLKELE
ncbi:MAG: septal ring lytic transglycosylase RlpA family protein [Treponema sp.]|jgi:rare lipoprotein A|nr:septal ring lytic transglycosylase RlpA family protein [Treponema sp.]